MDAEVVRLTPEQERERQIALAKRTAEREDRLRTIRFSKFLELKAEFGNLSEDEVTHLMNRAEIESKAKTGLAMIGAFALTKGAMVAAAKSFINFVRKLMPWNWTKAFVIRTGIACALVVGGALTSEQWREGKLISIRTAEINGITTAGLNHILDTEFHAGTPVTTWYLGLINGSSTPTLSAADTMASHAGWTEYTTYSQTNRVAWDETAASSGSMTSTTTSDFSMSGSGTVAGGFLTSVSTKSGNTGTLFMTATFSGGNQTVSNLDTLKLTYTLSTTAS